MDWFRAYHGTATDPKWRVVAADSGQPVHAVVAVWLMMLECASVSPDRGRIIGWNDRVAGAALDLPAEAIAKIRSAMQGLVLDVDAVCAWERRQPKREDDSKDRRRAYRERTSAKPEPDPPGDAAVTQRDAPVTHRDNRRDKIREEKKEEDARASAPSDAKSIWFEGQALRVNRRDFETWQRLFPGYADLWGELAGIDVKLAAQGHVPGSKSFLTAAGWLKAGHERITRARSPPEPLGLVPCDPLHSFGAVSNDGSAWLLWNSGLP